MTATRRTLSTQLLHAALPVSLLWQWISSNVIERPRARQPANTLHALHEIGGLLTLGLVVAFWPWARVRRRETSLTALFPWFGAARPKAVGAGLGQHWRLALHPALADGAGAAGAQGGGQPDVGLRRRPCRPGVLHQLLGHHVLQRMLGHAGDGGRPA